MMGNAVKVGDIGSAHDGYFPTPVVSGSGTVIGDGSPLARVGDPLLPHIKPKNPPHGRSIKAGSSSVFIDGKAAVRDGDAIDCGGTVSGGGTINIG
ncbi:type VI secretion system PAAR protein [uncultured Shewanella sp.]|uniref:type VI secretion system PAAR protein n=1 Tax=uncultured Shewanella sp. TaxID=173975 RepID=UPI00262056F0|nr:type VI secretion system PAAR protein [uncultured Shewanella sp.]